MSLTRRSVDMPWPPGTVRIEDLHSKNADIILQPQPTTDPNDPLNWPSWRKYLNFILVNFYVLLVFALINMVTVTWASMNLELGFSYDILNDSYAAGCGSLCIGGIFLLPFALKYGRRPVYILSLAVQCGIAVWSARVQNVADLMMVNILGCFVGALCEVMMQMTVADVFFVHQRGLMNSIYIWVLTIGSSLAPLAAGYVTASQGWRWVWWWTAILIGVFVVLMFFLYEETKYECKTLDGFPTTNRPSQDDFTGSVNQALEEKSPPSKDTEANTVEVSRRESQLTRVEIDPTIPVKPYWKKLALWSSSPRSIRFLVRHSYQPFLILWHIRAVLYMSLLNGAMTAAAIMPITVYSVYMTLPPYNFEPQQIGLLGLPAFIGTLIAALICGPLSDWMILRMARSNGGIYEPEMRLWLILAFTPFVAAGLLMFGIGLDRGLPWPFVAVGLGVGSFGMTPAMSLSLTYLTDAYTEIISDSLVAVTFVKNLFPTILVFALTPWITAVGLGNVFITAAVIFVFILLGNIIFIRFGKRFRMRSAEKYRLYAGHSLEAA
ncbi:uncharacterized protein PV07_00140 [Cladophialophora immunda]|uniref:Major facilitator superfamily (MFS) profile domain-containing protein n=1 Tax=Cladophialophora immunda TaxID=569365 RepID=A0A0D2CTL8_9EURO|nr:uncharacterized protein PV07_00140 [Cladophialophora immunda]KIW33280.1 hypothetical protein PV07_00140 [Cladophialophora immunda]